MSFADKVSSIRIVLIPVFVSLLIYSRREPSFRYAALIVFLLAVLSDFFDGLVARIKKEKSELGQVIDPLADKLLLLTAFISLYLLKFAIPLGVVLVVVSRDVILILGCIVLTFLKITTPIHPTIWGKLTTFFQMLVVFMVLLEKDLGCMPFIFGITVSFTVISGIGYIVRGVRSLNGTSVTAR